MTIHHRTRRWKPAIALLATAMMLLAACGGSDSEGGDGGEGDEPTQTVRISSQDFSEQKTLAELYGQYLAAQGYDVDVQPPIGTRTQLYAALDDGSIDMILDYQGSAVVELGAEPSSDADETSETLTTELEAKDLVAAERAEAVDANALVALTSFAEENDVKTISDLADLDGPLTLGGAPECAERDDCLAGYNGGVYDLDLEFTPVDYGPPLVAALEAGEIQLAQYGTTAPEVTGDKLLVLEDDKGLQAAENVVPIYRSAIDNDELTTALNDISEQLTTEDLAAFNQSTDIDNLDPADVAEAWLQDKGLI